MRRVLATLALAIALPSMAQTPPKVYAAGSLKSALAEAAALFKVVGGGEIAFEFGPSGVLRDRLAKGEAADVFASANMEHPKALADAGKAEPVRMFARNSMCAVAHPELNLNQGNFLPTLLDPNVKLATSTPKADPSGDYAWLVFERAEKIKPGAYEALSKKALQLVGGPNSPAPPSNRSLYGLLLERGDADLFLTYCTNATIAKREVPSLVVVPLPESLSVGAEYGLVTMNGASAASKTFADFLLSPAGQSVLQRAGFAPPR